MKKYLSLGMILVLLFSALLVGAKPSSQAAAQGKNVVSIPSNAKQISQNTYYLGTAIDKGRVVEGYAIIDYGKGHAKPGTVCGNGVCEAGESARKCPADCAGGGNETPTSTCYGFLATGAKWKAIEPYIVDPANTRGLGEAYVRSNLAADIGKWEAAAGAQILGDETNGTVDGADTVSTDGKNEVYFADVADAGAIAVTIVWGIFRGNPAWRELVEWDQVYDQVDYDWSSDCLSENCSSRMDFESIATHELGHSVGLDDLYTIDCSEETMYGYAAYAETKKRTLEAGDITGVSELY